MGNMATTDKRFGEQQVLLIGEWPLLFFWVNPTENKHDKQCSICKEPASRYMDSDNSTLICDKLHGIPRSLTSSLGNDDKPTCDRRGCSKNAVVRTSVRLISNAWTDHCWEHLFENEKEFPALARIKELAPDHVKPQASE